VVVRFVEIGEIVDNYCLEMTLRFVDFGGIVDNYCLEMTLLILVELLIIIV
jgi:hypothetical protein